MEISPELTAILSGIGVIQGFFLSVYLLQLKSGNRQANVFLVFLLIGISFRVGKSVLNYYLSLEPWHRNIGLSAFLIVGPSLFFYGKTLSLKNWKLRKLDYLHYVPTLFYFLFCWAIPNQMNDFPSYLSYSFVLIQTLTYGIISFAIIRKKSIESQTVQSWYKKLLFGVICLWFFYVLIFLRIVPTYIGGAILNSFLIYSFSYMLLKVHIFNLEKYGKSNLEKKEADYILKQLHQLFDRDKLFLKNDLSLNEMADKLGVNHRKLSQAINERLDKNFAELINEFRIREAKQLLKNPEMVNQKIAAIAFDSGFNNLTSFNQSFKKITKLTPHQYRKKFLIKQS